jgi:hypothetical protein
MQQPPLFNTQKIFDVIDNQKANLREVVRHLPEAEINADNRLVVERLVEQFALNVPVLQEDKKYATKREVDVTRQYEWYVYGDSEPRTVRGLELTIHIPFEGEAALFHVQPTRFNLNLPRGETAQNELLIVLEIVGDEDITADLINRVAAVKQHLDWLRPSAAQLRRELEELAGASTAQRKSQLTRHEDVIFSLGIPVVTAASSAPESYRMKATPRNKEEAVNRWDVFISHAHEDKDDVAKPLANALREKGLAVWYDEFSLALGDSLRQSVDRGLANSRYGIVVLSEHFFAKHWPTQELNGLVTRESNGQKVILPIWHKVTREQVSQYSPILADRLAASTEQGLVNVVQQIMRVLSN